MPRNYHRPPYAKYGITQKIPCITIYNRGEIIIVPFPFSDQSSAKKRPAVIISSDKYNQIFQDVIIAVTSQTNKNIDYYDAIIENWKSANLLKPSVIKPVISTIEKQLIIKRLGLLAQKDTDTLNRFIQDLLA